MNAFVINRHGRLVFPSNLIPELDFSAIETLDQLDSVIRRDFETKAPSGTGHPREGPDRRVRQPVRADAGPRAEPVLGQPLRDDHVREATDPVGATCHAPAPTSSCRSSSPGRTATPRSPPSRTAYPHAAGPVGRRGRGPHLRDALRRLRAPQAPRDHAAGHQADRGGVPRAAGQPDLPAAGLRPGLSGVRLHRHHRLRRGRARARGAAPVGDGAAQPVPVGPVPGRAGAGRSSCPTTTWSSPSTRGTARSGASCAA